VSVEVRSRLREAGGPVALSTATPPPVAIQLLGGFELRVRGRPQALSLGAQRLLALLALRDRPLPRVQAAGTLWPDAEEERAAANLRSTLWRVRRSGLCLPACSGNLLSLGPGVDVDLHAALAASRVLLASAAGAENLILAVPGALAMNGDLLPDWDDDWVLLERERFRQIHLHALERSCELLMASGRLTEAIEAGLAVLAAEPLRESAHRVLIRAHLAEGNRFEALRQFERYRHLMHSELGLAPSVEIAELIRAHLRT
jgi:DNA-binding SARP family transcriptional activator